MWALPEPGIKLVSHVLAGRFLSSAHQGSFPPCLVLLGFYLGKLWGFILYLEHSPLVVSFCLSLCFYFYVLGRQVLFPDLGEVLLCRTHPVVPSSTVPSAHQTYML